MPIREQRKEILIAFIRDIWNDGKIDEADKYIAPKYTIHHDPGDPWDKKVLDLEAYKERVRRSRAPFPDQTFDIQELFLDEKAVAITWLWLGTHTGDLPGFPATGKQIKMSGATVYYFEGNHITGHWQVTDRLGVFQQLREGSGTHK